MKPAELEFLKAIARTEGYPGPAPPGVHGAVAPHLAYPEVSKHTGIILQWHLTKDGHAAIKHPKRFEYMREKRKAEKEKYRSRFYTRNDAAPVALTIDVLDCLKSIRDFGVPNTTKFDILAAIQRAGPYGVLARNEGGSWSLTTQGRDQVTGFTRKVECAQFSGKVR